MNDGPVFIVDEDKDDQELVKQVWEDIGFKNPLLFFSDGEQVLKHLKKDPAVPFLIISDVTLPKRSGFELREKLINDPSLKYKTIPFVFWTSGASPTQIKKGYDVEAHGFFIKEMTYQGLKKQLADIMEYWSKSKSPE